MNNHQKPVFPRAAWLQLFAALLFLGWACTPEDEILTSEKGVQLAFSQDTVPFDTVFTTVGSTTKWLQVYNPQRNAVNITSIRLAANTQNTSPYRIIVNGEAGTQFDDILLRGGDSLLVLVEVTVDPQDRNLPFIVEDSIEFLTNGNAQYIHLEAWGQDAFFLKSGVVAEDITFSAERPYVVCDSLWVLPEATLTLAPGAQLYFNDEAYLLVGGTLHAEGTPEDRIVLQHIRSDGDYLNAPGQWQGVFFAAQTQDNRLNFATIRNANVGVSINSPDNDTIPDITLANTIIENMAAYGVYSVDADIEAYNTLISHCMWGLVRGLGRASYRLRHCTLTNESTFSFSPADSASLVFKAQATLSSPNQDFYLDISNSIVWGNLESELYIRPATTNDRLILNNNIIKTTDTTRATTNLYNAIPEFVAADLYNYRLDSLSPAIDAGSAVGILQDIEGNARDETPDLGAYEYIE